MSSTIKGMSFSALGLGQTRRRFLNLFLPAIIPCLLLIGCASIQMRGGIPVDQTRLKTLHIGQSTESDVLAALGEPFGRGSSMLPFHDSPVEMWSYYYEESTLSESRRKLIFVYLDDGIYDGHMWFSSLPE
jgi:hypothetical protein